MKSLPLRALATAGLIMLVQLQPATAQEQKYVFEAGHPSLQEWVLPDWAPAPENNKITPERINLGKKLFFDPRLSGDGTISCATCHNPVLGWADGLPTGQGFKGKKLPRATPTIINAGFNSLQMWDGREPTLESQATGPLKNPDEMNRDVDDMIAWLKNNPEYVRLFEKAYPGEGVTAETYAKAVATFERTIVSSGSPFARWVRGDANAMTPQQIEGFKLFVGKAECIKCHSAPNFTDNGFHNLGLASYGKNFPDLGRGAKIPVKVLRGAFKTPTLWDVERTAPYFHDGSAKTLREVVEHYNRGGDVKTDLDPNIRPLNLTDEEIDAVVAFMRALTSPFIQVSLPEIPYKEPQFQ